MALPPRLRKSRQQEARGASLHGGSRNAGSGNTPWRKNDVRVDNDYLIEYKRTDGKSITLQLSDLEDLRTNALLESRTPLMGIEIGSRDWTLIPTDEFERMRSQGAGGRLDAGEVPERRPRSDVPADRSGAQEDPQRSQSHLSRARRAQRLPGAGGMP
jgi:hypothetical protein